MGSLIQNILNSGLDPEAVPPWVLRPVRYVNLTLLVMFCVGLPYVQVYWQMGLRLIAGVVLLGVISAPLIIAGLRRGLGTTAAGNLTTLAVFIPVVISFWETGALHNGSAGWLLVIPMLGTLLAGARSGLVWSLVVGLTLGLTWAGYRGGLEIPPPLPAPAYLEECMAGLLGALLTVSAISLGFIRQSQAAQAQAEQIIEVLQQEIASRCRAEAEAREALATRSRFLAMMSHEIRTPMNGVLGMNQLLIETGLDAEQSELANTALSAGRALLQVLNDILDFSKLEAGRVEIESIPFQLPALLQDVGGLYRATAWDKGLEISIRVSTALPEWVSGDPTRLRQVLLNLLNNAIKFTPAGEIRLEAQRGVMDTVRFSVSDTGIGITPEAQVTLFEAFTQAEASTTRRYGGTGLGLTICAQLVGLMQGELKLESAVGEGSTFHFGLVMPAASAPADEPDLQAAAASMRVLLAEDNPVNQKLAVRLLSKVGHRVDVVENGRLAVAALASGRVYDVVLMDMLMPEMDGIEATHLIRALPGPASEIPIIALTASASEQDRERCEAAGMDDFLTKPYDFEVFRRTLLRYRPRTAA